MTTISSPKKTKRGLLAPSSNGAHAILLRQDILKQMNKVDIDDIEEMERYNLKTKRGLRPIRDMRDFLIETYEFRHNILLDTFEFHHKNCPNEPFWTIDQTALNTIAIEVQEAGIFVSSTHIKEQIVSFLSEDYHPIRNYINKIKGTWDGKDRVTNLFNRLHCGEYGTEMGHLWLRAVTAEMMGLNTKHANSVMLLLTSPLQGINKSTFLRCLVPQELENYYTDDFSLTQKATGERKLVEFFLINIDEFDKESPKKMPLLKTLMQTLKPTFRGVYKRNFNTLPRIASFCGTSNQQELLTDRTGSRRFLILQPMRNINVDNINIDQIYAQLIEEIKNGQRYWFTKEEEKKMEEHNKPYYQKNELEKLITRYFQKPEEDDVAGKHNTKNNAEVKELSTSEIYNQLFSLNKKLLKDFSVRDLGTTLSRIFGKPIHTRHGSVYRVIKY